MINKKKKALMIKIASGVLALVVSLALGWGISLKILEDGLDDSTTVTLDNFTGIMENYEKSFELYESNIQLELQNETDIEEIRKYLKSHDEIFANIEGQDFDGVYCYYKGNYLYSWNTPEQEYIDKGYNAQERPWYIGAVEADGELWISTPYPSFVNDYILMTISRLQADKETVIAYDIKLYSIEGYARKVDLCKNSITLLSDKYGNVFGSNNKIYDGANLKLSIEEINSSIASIKEEMISLSDNEKIKAENQLAQLEEMKRFNQRFSDAINESVISNKTLKANLFNDSIIYTESNSVYQCTTVIYIHSYLGTILGISLGIFSALALIYFIVAYIHILNKHAKDIDVKNEELALAVKKADEANSAKSRFLAQMSHEIRTPMNAVIGLTSIAKLETNDSEKIMDDLIKIEKSSKLLLSIINDVLDMSSIEGGKLKIDTTDFDFKALISNITAIFYEQARQKNIVFSVNMQGVTEETIVGDELRVNQILMNLLSNAVKFTSSLGVISLSIIQTSRQSDKIQMRFIVSDTGCGISDEMKTRLFKPFEQETASTAKKHGGSGLGLSITRRLVEMMNGSISVESKVGKGTKFIVDIPFKLPAVETEKKTAVDFSNVHVLVVDDDKDSCEYCGVLLKRMNVRFDYVTSGEEALEAIENAEDKNDPYNLCLVDWKMPGMDGIELSSKIKEVFGNDTICVIVSAYDINEAERVSAGIGANYYIPKPLFQSSLYNALVKIAGGSLAMDKTIEPSKYDFTGKKVLLAEDVELNMEVAVRLLKNVNLEVICAEDGKQAFDIFKASKPGEFNCILLDINMPIMDGYEAAKAIRNLNRADSKSIAIYAMTANAFAEDVTSALNAGMNGHIAKPIETKILYSTLNHALNKDLGE